MPAAELEHFTLECGDLKTTRDFYCDVLGLTEGFRPQMAFPGYWLYSAGVACVHVAERTSYDAHATSMGLPAKASPVDHVAFEAHGYDALLERLEAACVGVTTNRSAAGVQLFFDDPNGARIELVVSE